MHEIEQTHVFLGLRRYMFLMKHCLYTTIQKLWVGKTLILLNEITKAAFFLIKNTV